MEQMLEGLFVKKLPPLSPGAKDTTAKVFPWIIIVFGGLGLLMWLSSLKFIFGFSGLYGYVGPSIFVMLSLVITPIIQAFVIYGGYLMLKKQRRGWIIALYMLVFGFIVNVLYFNVIGIIINILFTYLLFQIKEYHTN